MDIYGNSKPVSKDNFYGHNYLCLLFKSYAQEFEFIIFIASLNITNDTH